MSNPSFENIDQWLFEYMEGNLSPNQITQLEHFLLNNPEFDADMDAWQLAKADASPSVYPGVLGRKRKPIPFWMVPALALTATFIAGSFFGAYLTSPNAFKFEDVESVAQTMPHENNRRISDLTLKSNVPVAANDMNRRDRNLDQIANSILTNKTENFQNYNSNSNVYGFNQKTALTYVGSASSPDGVVNLKDKAATLLEKNLNKTTSFDLSATSNELEKGSENIVPNLNEDVITEKGSENQENGSEISENQPKSEENLDKTTKNLPESNSSETERQSVQVDPEVTATVMTRGGSRIQNNYHKTFSSSVKSTWRKVVRMTDNPIALTNSKDIYYHVPGMQTLNVNFATAGNLLRSRVQSVSRAQWTGHSTQQLMNELSFDTYVRSIRGGIGVQVNHAYYNLGTYNVGQVALTYSPKLTVKRNFSIEPAIRFKMGDKRLNAQHLVPGQIIEMERGNEQIFFNETPENQVKDLWYKDIGLGISSNTKWFSVGFQADNLGRHFNNAYNSAGKNDRAGIHYTATIGTDFVSRSKIFSFSPYLMYQKVENLSEIWGGSMFRYKILTLGGGISSSGDYAGSIGLKTDRFMLTYNADHTRSYLADKRLFSQQLTIRILMNNGYK